MYKIQKTALIFIVCLHIVRIHVRCRENRSYARRTSMLVLTRAHQVDNVCSWQLLTFHASSPHPLNKCPLSLWLYLCHCLSFSRLSHGFEHQRTCSYFCAFFTFILTQIFTSFHICASLFTASFCSLGFVTWRKIGVKNLQGSCPPALLNFTL